MLGFPVCIPKRTLNLPQTWRYDVWHLESPVELNDILMKTVQLKVTNSCFCVEQNMVGNILNFNKLQETTLALIQTTFGLVWRSFDLILASSTTMVAWRQRRRHQKKTHSCLNECVGYTTLMGIMVILGC